MKVILSRKGFDSENGGCPSPILEDGTLLSMPIPQSDDKMQYSDIQFNGISYAKFWKQLSPINYQSNTHHCHLDPDIRTGIRKNTINDWKPAFGQGGAAQSHLENQGVAIGDIFLFFGWFRQVECIAGKFHYAKNAEDLHVIYGYMQIDKILKHQDIKKYYWHPHANFTGDCGDLNALYIPSRHLVINGTDTGLRGFGTLNYDKKRVLTVPGMLRTRWKVPFWFKQINISYHSEKSFKDGYFQSAARGQEFVISENPHLAKWVCNLIKD